MKDLLIAIDQGGSKTEVIVFSPDGRLLLRTNDKDIRLESVGSFEDNRWFFIEQTILNALKHLGGVSADICGVIAAMCGADWPDDYQHMHEVIASRLHIPTDRVYVINDCVAALRAEQPIIGDKPDSAIIYAGTMFNCSLESKLGSLYTYGRLINGEDHGAFAIGKQVWNAILDSYNGFQDPTLMTNIFLERQNAASVLEVCEKFTNNSLAFRPVSFAPILFQAVEKEDIVAKKIFCKFADRWTRYVIKGAPLVGFTSKTDISLFLSGGVFKNCPQLWMKEIKQCLSHYTYRIDCSLAKLEPIAGAIIMLLEKYYHKQLDRQVLINLKQSDVFKTLLINSTIE